MYKNAWEKGILRVKLIIIKKKLTAHCQAIPSHSLRTLQVCCNEQRNLLKF